MGLGSYHRVLSLVQNMQTLGQLFEPLYVSYVMILFLGSTLFLISSFHAMSPFPGSLCYAYHHYLLILGTPYIHRMHPLTPMPFLALLLDRGTLCLSLLSHGQLLLQLILSYLLRVPLTYPSFHNVP